MATEITFQGIPAGFTRAYGRVDGAHYFEGGEVVCGATSGVIARPDQPGFVGEGCTKCHSAAESRMRAYGPSTRDFFLTDAEEREIERRQMGLGDL